VLRRLPLSSFLVVLAATLLLATVAQASGVAVATRAVQSIFFIAKSENKNQVHYGIRLDEACSPAGDSPMFAYWRMLERGPFATEPLLSREVPAYGFAKLHVQRDGAVGHVIVTLNALPKRSIDIDLATNHGTCTATARTVISGVPASLISVFAQLRWPLGVDYLVLTGRAIADGRILRERVSD
jgi:hypothetical protein